MSHFMQKILLFPVKSYDICSNKTALMPRLQFLTTTGHKDICEVSYLFVLWIKYASKGKDELKTLTFITLSV